MVSKDSELKSHKKQQKEENSERFREIKDVLRKNQINPGSHTGKTTNDTGRTGSNLY